MSPPFVMREMSSSTSRFAPATCSASPSRLIWLPRTCSRTMPMRSTLSWSWASSPPAGTLAGSELAKGSFFEAVVVAGRAEHVGVNVEHGLPRTLTLVEDEAALPARVLVGELTRGRDDL